MSDTASEFLLRNVARMFVSEKYVNVSQEFDGEIDTGMDDEVTLRTRYKSIRDSFKIKSWPKTLRRSKSTDNATALDKEWKVRVQRRAISSSPQNASPVLPLRPLPAPLLVEDPPSSDNASDLEDIRTHPDPALLNGSSGNFGSAGARSAPSTPHGLLSSSPGCFTDAPSHPSISGYITPSIQRSPSHNIFSKYDKGALKQLSCSTPAMTAQAQSPEPPSPKTTSSKDEKNTTSKARQKKFHRQFPLVDLDEKVLNHYSCALLGDIMLQGQLYITNNYFAFYSNVFGYVTKMLIPLLSVEKITKEKTAKIIPNAVGIATADDKHVFGSLISRDNTFRFMNDIWERARNAQALPEPDILPIDEDSDTSETREESGRESATSDTPHQGFRKCVIKPEIQKTVDYVDSAMADRSKKNAEDVGVSYLSKQRFLLFATTLLLVLLFLSAAVLLYRIGRIQRKYSLIFQDNMAIPESEDVYSEILQWQTHLHSKSADAVHSFLDTNLDQIAKVRQSLEALSTLLMPNDSNVSHNTQAKSTEIPAET